MPLIVRLVTVYAAGLALGFRAPAADVALTAILALAAGAGVLIAFGAGVPRRPGVGGGVPSRRVPPTLPDPRWAARFTHVATAAVLLAGFAVASAESRSAPPSRHRGSVPAVVAPLRRAANQAIDRAYGRDAPLAKALLTAERGEIPLEVRDRFATAGLAHVLSISGLHVGIAAMAIELMVRVAGASAALARGVTLLVLLVYVLMLGLPPPAVRAAAMFAAVAGTRALGRPTSPWAALAVGAAVPLLVTPRAVLSLGWQLSAAGVASLIVAGQAARRHLPPTLRGWRRDLANAAVASTIAAFASAPLVAWHFGRVSLVAPLANMVAAPVVGVLQPMLFLSLVLAPSGALSGLVAGAARVPLRLLDGIAERAAALPVASLVVAPTLAGAALATGAIVALLAAAASRAPVRPLLVAAALLTAVAWSPLLQLPGRFTELHVMDVGQGDAIALRTARGRWVLVDAGRAWRGGDAGRATVVPYVRRRGGAVAAFVLTHPHTDHVGGAATVIRALHPAIVYDPGYVGTALAYREALEAAAGAPRGARWRRVRPGDSLTIDEVTLRFLAPDSAWAASLRDPNEASAVLVAESGSVRFLLTGDAERGEEGWLLAHRRADLGADVLKVAHHGSASSSTAAFLAAVRPRLAVISVGAVNDYGHPAPATTAALEAAGAQLLRTDWDGTVVLLTDGRRLFAQVDGRRWEVEPFER